ncbi:protein FAR-RED IMPAIRED RESPONSE 1-like [Triticum urartu]|uniref:protein FAR-RED IMPAIRED RESPONSE 1-like n=1 Tax=Triticum urartu TaxID=4572 RepID=UPI00204386BD|nr:protein FAR-RED IMPAIRED RESPONSE 1-like [Triticum urartu]
MPHPSLYVRPPAYPHPSPYVAVIRPHVSTLALTVVGGKKRHASTHYACYDQPSSSRRRHLPPPASNVTPSSRSSSEKMDPAEILAAVQELEEEGDYDGDDYGEDNETSSLNMDEPAEENYMSLDESYSGNRHGDDDDDDMDIDDSFAESALRMDEDGDFVRNIVDDESDKSHVDASHDDSSSKGDVDGTSGKDEHVGDDLFNFDIGFDEYQQESLDMHWKVMRKTFKSLGEAYNFYNQYAYERGFSVRKDSLKYSKGPEGTKRLRKYMCARAGKRQAKLCTMEGRTRRLRGETRCFCDAHITSKLDKERDIWYVSSFSDDHSHVLARPDEVMFLRSHNLIKEYQKAEILTMAGAGIRKHMIYDNLVSRYGSYAKAGFGRKKLYNMCYREKMKLLAQGDADTAIGIMMTRKERDPDFFFEHTVDDEGRLKNIFWCDSQSRRDYVDYGDVTVFDSTYRMTRYGMPFIPFVGLNNHRCTTVFGCALVSDETEDTYVWLLQTFLRAHCQKRPRSVITDGDAAMIKAIRKTVPVPVLDECKDIEKSAARAGDRARYSELTILSAEATHKACHKPFLFDKLKAALRDIIDNDYTEEDEPGVEELCLNTGVWKIASPFD